MRKNAFTLIELLAVIVILAVILTISMPRITDLIENARKNSIRISALTLLDAAERQYTSNQIMEISSNSFECNKISNINNEDYQSCNIVFENNVPSISLLGSGKFKEYKCTGTKDNLYCRKIILVKVSIDLDGGTLDGNYNYAEDKEYLTLGIPEKENYDFDGWEVISGNSTVADNKVYIDGDTKLKAKWVLTPVVLPANATKYVSYLSAVNTSGLKVDDTDDKNIRYYGDDPNNYVAYNGEYWRIVGIFDVAKTIGGSKEKRVKIVRNGNLGNYSWDSTSSSDNSGYGYNVWETKDESSSSTLNILLNNYYYNSKNNQVCYNGEAFASVSCSFGSVGLDATARNLIDDSVWYLGGGSSTTINPKTSYEMERGNVVFADFADVAKTQTVEKVGLLYPSDYGYAADKNICTKNLKEYSDTTCTNNNYLYFGKNYWFLTLGSKYSFTAWYAKSTGIVSAGGYACDNGGVYPVVYLKANVNIVSGTGTYNSPYRLSI